MDEKLTVCPRFFHGKNGQCFFHFFFLAQSFLILDIMRNTWAKDLETRLSLLTSAVLKLRRKAKIMSKKYSYENTNTDMLDIKQTAKLLGTSERFVRLLLERGRLKYIRHSARMIRISKQAINEYIASRTIGSAFSNN